MAEPQGGKKPQVLLCASAAQVERAAALFPTKSPRYVNGDGWESIAGARVICLGWPVAHLANGYAAEVRVLPAELPDTLTQETALAWAKAEAVPYAAPQVAAPDSPPAAAEKPGASPPPSATTPLPAGAAPDALQDAQDESEIYAAEWPEGALETRPSHSSRTWDQTQSEDMGQPADLWGHDDALPQMDADSYPDALRAYVVDEAEVMGCDPGMLALYCIATCAGAVTDEIRVQVKAASDRWQESARVWVMVVGDSGLTMKSPTLDAAMRHAWKIEREMRVNGGQALKDYDTERQIYEAQKAEYVKKRSKGEAAEAPVEPPLPIAERLIVGNATLEAIGDVLLQQGERGVLVRADELLGIVAGMNQYKGGKGSDRAEWLEMWNGGPHPIDRKGRAVLVKNWGASIVGGTQPEAIARVGQSLESDGLLQRFTIYLPRYSDKGTDSAGSPDARRRYNEMLDRLVKLSPLPDQAPVRFSPEASAVIDSARTWIMDTARGGWMPAGLRSHLAKWPAMLARFCLTYAAIEAADEHHAAIPTAISGRIAEQVWTMMHDVLWPHAKQFYISTLSGTGDRAALRQMGGLILSAEMREISTRSMVQRASIYRAADQYQRRNIVGAMCELGWISPATGKSMVTGMPTRYRVNELVHTIFAERAEQEKQDRAERVNLWRDAKLDKVRAAGED